jgi:hydrogenase maturation protein HypF
MAEHGLDGPVIGVAYDGTGYGCDGTSWGGEILLAAPESFERLATFRPIALAGGETAIREVWRIALALLDDGFHGAPPLERIPLLAGRRPQEITTVRRMAARGVNTPRARGVGRYFDAVGALVLGRSNARYEGEIALALNGAADPGERGVYPFSIDTSASPATLDLAPMVREVVADLLAGGSPGAISARFHNTLAKATGALVRLGASRSGRLPVVLTGGCFQNALLAERILEDLGDEFRVLLHRRVPPGDGGIALGQAFVAAAAARQGGGL